MEKNNLNEHYKESSVKMVNKAYSFEYFIGKEDKLPTSIKEKIQSKYAYLWSKASNYLSIGSQLFRKEDHFNYPLEDWDLQQIEAGVIQIVQHLKGVSPEHYIQLNNIKNAEQLMLTLHFEKHNEEKLNDNIFEVMFRHKIDREKITMYFKLGNNMDKSNEDEIEKGTIPGGFGEFGHEKTNPIPVNTISGSLAYLEKLRTLDGNKVKYKRTGSTRVPNINKPVDAYKILDKEEVIATLYINAYNNQNSERPPKGFKLSDLH